MTLSRTRQEMPSPCGHVSSSYVGTAVSASLQELATAPKFYIHTVGAAQFFVELRGITASYNSGLRINKEHSR
jgi:hypothetical protein